ncbi:hypothetical protein CDAR_513331 [Caerostris darwini]|uniref:Uncharacterized protein n=1 Tax=Caerostris darwini TaxID=1538125 RepID=A0AAV4T3K1_9ARAC|nr:hypothetical protein CDAR_513331 [Caerostris darwini]
MKTLPFIHRSFSTALKFLTKQPSLETVHFKDPCFKVRSEIHFSKQNLIWSIFDATFSGECIWIRSKHLVRPFCPRSLGRENQLGEDSVPRVAWGQVFSTVAPAPSWIGKGRFHSWQK